MLQANEDLPSSMVWHADSASATGSAINQILRTPPRNAITPPQSSFAAQQLTSAV